MKKKTAVSLILFPCLAIIAIFLFWIFHDLLWLILVAALMAYLLYPMTVHFSERGVPVKSSIFLVYAIVGTIFLFIICVFLPYFFGELSAFWAKLPRLTEDLSAMWERVIEGIRNLIGAEGFQSLERYFTSFWQDRSSDFAVTTLNRMMELPQKITYLLLSPVLAYYFLRDHQKIGGGLISIFPPQHRSSVLLLAKETNDVLWGFIRGNLFVSLVVGVITFLGLWILGVDYPLMLGALAGILDIIPYFGPFLSAVPILIIASFQPEVHFILVIILLIAVQQFENIFVSPRVIGDQVGLHPVSIIILVLIGGYAGGLFGMVLMIPVAAVGKVILRFCYEKFVSCGSD
ncbi:MAG: AI-2E family transporter [Bacillota bacterium]|nr:AI-2E family transporter [Bacillota bacterium]